MARLPLEGRQGLAQISCPCDSDRRDLRWLPALAPLGARMGDGRLWLPRPKAASRRNPVAVVTPSGLRQSRYSSCHARRDQQHDYEE